MTRVSKGTYANSHLKRLSQANHKKAGFPLTLELKSPNLPKKSWLKISQIRTLSVEKIGKVTGKTSLEELNQAVEGLNEIIA